MIQKVLSTIVTRDLLQNMKLGSIFRITGILELSHRALLNNNIQETTTSTLTLVKLETITISQHLVKELNQALSSIMDPIFQIKWITGACPKCNLLIWLSVRIHLIMRIIKPNWTACLGLLVTKMLIKLFIGLMLSIQEPTT